MKYDLNKQLDIERFKEYSNKMLALRKEVELKEIRITRSGRQNKALHLLFSMVSNELNELGLEHRYYGVTGKELSTRYTSNIVKEFFYRPIQIALFDIHSTTKVDTRQINEVVDVIIKFFSDRGVVIQFPSMESLID